MPVQVSLPGYRHAAPIAGLADVVNTIGNIRQRSKQGDLVDEQTKNEELKNQSLAAGNAQSMAYQKALQDPASQETKAAKAGGSALLSSLSDSGLFKSPDAKQSVSQLSAVINDPSTSGYQVHQLVETSPFLKSLTGLGEAKLKAESIAPLAEARMESVRNQKDKIAASAADHFDRDPILTKINKQKQQVDLDKHTLDTAQVLTPQIINEIQQGIANAISGGGSAGLGKTEQTEIQTAKQKVAELQQRFSSNPTPVNDPALVQYFQGVLGRLGDAYDKNGYARAQQIFKGRAGGYKSNPAAVQVMQDKVESFRPTDTGAGAQAQPPHGPTVIQNGHTYNWNAQTGQYE